MHSDDGQPLDYGRVPAWAIDELFVKLSRVQQAIYTVICRHANREWNAWPSRKTIASKAGTSEKSVTRAFSKLSDVGLIEVIISGGGGRQTNLIRVVEIAPRRDTKDVPAVVERRDTKDVPAADERGDISTPLPGHFDPRDGTQRMSHEQHEQKEQRSSSKILSDLGIKFNDNLIAKIDLTIGAWPDMSIEVVAATIRKLWNDVTARKNKNNPPGLFLKMLKDDGPGIASEEERRLKAAKARDQQRRQKDEIASVEAERKRLRDDMYDALSDEQRESERLAWLDSKGGKRATFEPLKPGNSTVVEAIKRRLERKANGEAGVITKQDAAIDRTGVG